MPVLNPNAPPPGQHGTFAQWRDWANHRYPGSGDQFISWVKANTDVPPPYVFDINADSYGPTGYGDNNYAENYFGAWLLFGNLGPGIGKTLQLGITGGSKDIPKALKGFSQAIPKIPVLSGIDELGAVAESFYDVITDGKMWRSLGWIVLGIVLIVAGLYFWVRTSGAYVSAEHAIEGVV